ncbi:MAG: carboxymuconolactone decarboxylase family protein, partial [Paracoccaceae bacterium]
VFGLQGCCFLRSPPQSDSSDELPNVATTHLWPSGARRHIQNALEAGATKEEILEVIQLTSIMGIHSMSMGVPILMEEIERFERNA